MIDFSKLQRDYATYLPAISKGYGEAVFKPFKRSVPIEPKDLDFFDTDTSLFYLPSALYSAGQAGLPSKTASNVYQRDRAKTFLLGDSGGFQIIEGTLKIAGKVVKKPGDKERGIILGWLEKHCDWAMTLDVPPAALDFPTSGYSQFRDCLADTHDHVMYFEKHRKGRTKFLNCLHGRNEFECELWYNAFRQFEFEGWAFGSGYKENPYLVLHRLLSMRDDGYLKDKERFHFLGQGGLVIACVLTSIQRALRQHINPEVCVTFDTSSPFTQAAECQVFSGYVLKPKTFSISKERMPDSPSYVGSDIPFPWRSPIGEQLTLGDLCVKSSGATAWDGLTGHMMMNHNVFMQMDAIIAANRVYELEAGDAKKYCPTALLEIRDIIAEAFETQNWDTLLTKHRNLLQIKSNDFTDGLNVRGDF